MWATVNRMKNHMTKRCTARTFARPPIQTSMGRMMSALHTAIPLERYGAARMMPVTLITSSEA
jgi:hypothetical protein